MEKSSDKVIRVAAATPKIEVANVNYNLKSICEIIIKAESEGVNLLCLPELCITGSTCGSLFLQPALITGAKDALLQLAEFSRDKNVITAVGLPIEREGKLFNAAAVLHRGKILGIVPKPGGLGCYMPQEIKTVKLNGEQIPFGEILFCYGKPAGLAQNGEAVLPACENSPRFTFAVQNSAELPEFVSSSKLRATADIILHLAATHELVGRPDCRRKFVAEQSLRQYCGYVYANAGCGESTTDFVFGCHNLIAASGIILHESPPFGRGWAVAEIDIAALGRERKHSPEQNLSFAAEKSHESAVFTTDISGEALPQTTNPMPFVKNPEEALAIQTAGLATRIRHTNGTAVIGVSGGLDSCLALLVAARAHVLLGKPVSEIAAVTMPGFGTTSRTKSNAHKLCEALGIKCREIDITKSVALHLKDINHPQGVYDVVFENAQARMRTYILMDIANQVNGQVIGTGSLSELALGWATYNGDHMSMYSVNAGVPKTLVRHLVEHIAATCESAALKEVLESILGTKFSPELLPTLNDETTQITEDAVGPYALHDFFIYHFLRHCRAPKEIFALAKLAFVGKYSTEEILKWLKIFYTRFFAQQFKRSCLPDGPQVVEVSLSPRAGFKMPSDASAEIWISELSGI